MVNANLHEADLAGRDYLSAVTDLLLLARGDDAMTGLWEAADLQWWWAVDEYPTPRRNTFWLDTGGRPAASLLIAQPKQGEQGAVYSELLWRPAADAQVRAQVFPVALQRLVALAGGADRPVWITVDERDSDLRQRLEAAGFRHDPDEDMVQMWLRREALPDPIPLSAGLRFDDDRSRPANQPHHLAKRNGERVAERLRETSLYRPDLDLCIRTEAGDVAGYCVCWLDSINGVGLFEPVRTEDTYQRRGIGRALLTEGSRHLMAEGARLLKVSRDRSQEAARGLYASVGFRDAFGKLRYVRA